MTRLKVFGTVWFPGVKIGGFQYGIPKERIVLTRPRFVTSSFGRLKLDVDADFSKFYRMPQHSAKYTFNRFGAKQEMYIRDALSVEKGNYTNKKYDVLYIMPTRNAKEITFSPTKISPSRAPGGGSFPNTVTYGQDLHLKYGFKILNHETGHVMGLPDLCMSIHLYSTTTRGVKKERLTFYRSV
jgi:M6 family metalloprotease-like protein